MKRLIVFLLILAGSFLPETFACGPYYPFGDDIRFVLWRPETFNDLGFQPFSYTADRYYSSPLANSPTATAELMLPNLELWHKRCANKPLIADVYSAVYLLGDEINNPESNNTFISFLHQHKDQEALSYLNFAKRCSSSNTIMDDPWERNQALYAPKRRLLIDQSLKFAQSTQDEDIRLRYAFLAIRLAWYNSDSKQIQEIYSNYFSKRKIKNIVDYWGLYFLVSTENDAIKRNYYAALIFEHAPDKRLSIFTRFDSSIAIEKVLANCKNTEEQSAVWMLSAFRKSGKTSETLQKIYALNPASKGLGYLLLREVNKVEDWIFTPYYTSFSPSLTQWDEEQKPYPSRRIEEDRKYAGNLLSFVNLVDFRRVENPTLWKMAQAWLNYMTGNYNLSLAEIAQLRKEIGRDPKVVRQLDILKALCINVRQKGSSIQEQIKPILMSEHTLANYKFIFAIARELEFRGNTTDAAMLMSKLKERSDKMDEPGFWRNSIYWKSRANHFTQSVNFYGDYFFYLDAQYTSLQITNLVETIKNNTSMDPFSQWKCSIIKGDIPRLHDLAGTKYMRGNHLNEALRQFELVNDTLWISKNYPYRQYLNANPFYTNFYNEHRKTKADTIQMNKAEITRRLINCLREAEDPSGRDRDLNYFLAANCYFNMTQHGNSWMMRRYYWSIDCHLTGLEDDDEYFNCKLAMQYYLKAKVVSRNEKFQALCLRMAGRCEQMRIKISNKEDQKQTRLSDNIYYSQLKSEYSECYTDLVGNCEAFEKYFESRKQ